MDQLTSIQVNPAVYHHLYFHEIDWVQPTLHFSLTLIWLLSFSVKGIFLTNYQNFKFLVCFSLLILIWINY